MAETLTDDQIAQIGTILDQAEAMMAKGWKHAGVQLFAAARELLVEMPGDEVINKIVARNEQTLVREREHHRKALAKREKSGRPVLIMADSLALPRPVPAGSDPLKEKVYPVLLAETMPKHPVISICQRYFTTDHVRRELEANPSLGQEADVILHVGLNDCAFRMFRESERLALDLLPQSLSERLVDFTRCNRRAILTILPSHHYVTLEQFSSNLDAILLMLRQRKARKIVMATMILSPLRTWADSPGVNLNFARYNVALMEAALRYGARVLDFDRHIWLSHHLNVQLDDGIHLTSEGHRLFARETLQLLRYQ